jgi:hypothetical protein
LQEKVAGPRTRGPSPQESIESSVDKRQGEPYTGSQARYTSKLVRVEVRAKEQGAPSSPAICRRQKAHPLLGYRPHALAAQPRRTLHASIAAVTVTAIQGHTACRSPATRAPWNAVRRQRGPSPSGRIVQTKAKRHFKRQACVLCSQSIQASR